MAIDEEQLKHVIGYVGGGVNKRIDEIRELYELLKKDAPELLQNHPHVEGWFQAEDDFLNAIDQCVTTSDTRFPKRPDRFPRKKPW